MWLSGRTRPDVAFAVSRLASQAASNPQWALRLGKRILRYLAGTRSHGLVFKPQGEAMKLEVYADASFEPEVSQTGVSTFLGGCLVDWRSCKQPQPARSTAEAEITALSMGCVMLEGAEAVLGSMGIRPSLVQMWGDNSASLCIATGQGSWRTRALANRASALRARTQQETLSLGFVGTQDQRADGLTKTFSVQGMQQVRKALGLRAL